MNNKEFKDLIKDVKLEGMTGFGVPYYLLYTLFAWKVISKDLKDIYKFDNFYNNEITIDKLLNILNKQKDSIKFIEEFLFGFETTFEKKEWNLPMTDNDLIKICNIVNDIDSLPKVTEGFKIIQGDKSNTTGEIELDENLSKLIGKLIKGNNIYVPFTHITDFVYSIDQYTQKEIYYEMDREGHTLEVELMNILDKTNITYEWSNSILLNPTYINPNASHLLKQFDCVVSFPPINEKIYDYENNFAKDDKYNRFKIHKGSSSEIAKFEHILSQTKNKAIVIMPVGFTYRGGKESEFRKYLIENNYLDSIMQLPANINSNTSIELTIVIIDKNKKDENCLFINLKDDIFLTKNKRKIVLNNIDKIVKIYNDRLKKEQSSSLINNKDIKKNGYSFSIDRYVLSSETSKLKDELESFNLIELQDFTTVRKSQQFKQEFDGEIVYELSPSDFARAGMTTRDNGRVKRIGSQTKKLSTYQLNGWDVLLSTKGTIGKVALVLWHPDGYNNKLITSQANVIIRFKDIEKYSNKHINKAICLYMYLKSDIGQRALKQLVSGTAMPQISTEDIKKLHIPIFTEDQQKKIIKNFSKEFELYKKIIEMEKEMKVLVNNF